MTVGVIDCLMVASSFILRFPKLGSNYPPLFFEWLSKSFDFVDYDRVVVAYFWFLIG